MKDVAKFIRDKANIPIEIEGKELVIPVEFEYGENWKELQSYELRTEEAA
jgi:hypothetical protein